jgi:hypothetical protein
MPVSEMRMSRPGSAIPATAAPQKSKDHKNGFAVILDKQATHRV